MFPSPPSTATTKLRKVNPPAAAGLNVETVPITAPAAAARAAASPKVTA
jgi:hypothetical protein